MDIATGGATGRGHAGEQDAAVRVAIQQRFDQGLDGSRLADRDGVYPDQRAVRAWRKEAVAFAEMMQVVGLTASPPEQAQPDQRQGEEKTQ